MDQRYPCHLQGRLEPCGECQACWDEQIPFVLTEWAYRVLDDSLEKFDHDFVEETAASAARKG